MKKMTNYNQIHIFIIFIFGILFYIFGFKYFPQFKSVSLWYFINLIVLCFAFLIGSKFWAGLKYEYKHKLISPQLSGSYTPQIRQIDENFCLIKLGAYNFFEDIEGKDAFLIIPKGEPFILQHNYNLFINVNLFKLPKNKLPLNVYNYLENEKLSANSYYFGFQLYNLNYQKELSKTIDLTMFFNQNALENSMQDMLNNKFKSINPVNNYAIQQQNAFIKSKPMRDKIFSKREDE